MLLQLHLRAGKGSANEKGGKILVNPAALKTVSPINSGGAVLIFTSENPAPRAIEVFESIEAIFAQVDNWVSLTRDMGR